MTALRLPHPSYTAGFLFPLPSPVEAPLRARSCSRRHPCHGVACPSLWGRASLLGADAFNNSVSSLRPSEPKPLGNKQRKDRLVHHTGLALSRHVGVTGHPVALLWHSLRPFSSFLPNQQSLNQNLKRLLRLKRSAPSCHSRQVRLAAAPFRGRWQQGQKASWRDGTLQAWGGGVLQCTGSGPQAAFW